MAIKYKWLAETLKNVIKKNMENGINKLPSENELCRRYHVSRQTVRQSLAILEAENLIERKQGSGAFITGLSTDKSRNTIAILMSNDQYYMSPAIINSIQNTLFPNGYETTLYLTDNQICKEREILEQLLKRPPRGLIIEPVKPALPNPNLDLYLQLKNQNCQLLFLQNSYPEFHHGLNLKTADYKGSTDLTKYLISEHHTQIGGIFLSDSLSGHERYLGFMETMQSHHIPVKDQQICWLTSEDLDELRTVRHSSKLRKYVTQNILTSEDLWEQSAYICCNTEIAFALCQEIQYTSESALEPLSIAAFDHNYLNHFHKKRFIVMDSKHEDIGQIAADMMIQKLKGLPVLSQEIPFHILPLS